MSIDGIGKPGSLPGAPAAGAPGAAPASSNPFELGLPEAATEPGVPPGVGSDALRALSRGEIDVAQYLDARVESSVAPFASRLSPDQLEFMKAELRAQLETDPVLVELAGRVTAGTPFVR